MFIGETTDRIVAKIDSQDVGLLEHEFPSRCEVLRNTYLLK